MAAQRQRYEQYSVVVEEVGVWVVVEVGVGVVEEVEEVGVRAEGRSWRGDQRPRPLRPTHPPLQVPLQPGEGLSYRGDDYEDEYDDTYDGNQVGANDADSDDELISRR